MEVSGQLHASAALPSVERTIGINYIGGWVRPRAGLGPVEENLCPPRGITRIIITLVIKVTVTYAD
jgi:hypothetical protein